MPPRQTHHTGRPRCDACVQSHGRCNRALPACGSCVKYDRECSYQEETPEPQSRQSSIEPAARTAGMRIPRVTPTILGSYAPSLTPIPSRAASPTHDATAIRRTRSLSSILGDRTDIPNRKRDERSPSPTIANELAARTERLRRLRAQINIEASEVLRLDAILNRHPSADSQNGRRGTTAADDRQLEEVLAASTGGLVPSHATASGDTDDSIIPGFQASGVILTVPDSIIQNMKKGWHTPFSIAMLRDDYCIALASRPRKGRTIAFGDEGDEVTFAASAESFDSSLPEDCLTYEEWVQAWRRLLHLIQLYFSEPNAQRWRAHFTFIDTRPNRAKQWKLWLRYDIAVRRATRSDRRIDPSVFHASIFHDLIPQYTVDTALKATTPSNTFPMTQARQIHVMPKGHTTGAGAAGAAGTPMLPSHAPNISKRQAKKFLLNEAEVTPGSFMANPSATNTTELEAHVEILCARMANTPALCVVPTNTGPKHADVDPRKIVTPLIPSMWEHVLRSLNLWHQFHDIPVGLSQGFRIGTSATLQTTSIPPNHKSSIDHAEFVDKAIQKEIQEGRYSGPFTPHDLEAMIGPFRSAPLGVVAKSKPGEFRIVQDFSFPRGGGIHPALNSEINADDFTCDWGFFHDIVAVVLTCPPGTQAATLDVDAAYRRMPIYPGDQIHTVVAWKDRVWVDHCVPFGATSSNGIFGRCGDAMAKVAEARGMGPVRKWVDDFLFFRYTQAQYSMQDIFTLADQLGWPWKESKTVPFAETFTYLGFEWHLPSRTVSIPKAKRDKYMERTREWLAKPRADLAQTEKLVGSLSHCTQVMTNGIPHLAGLISFSASFPRTHSVRFRLHIISVRARTDAEWWLEQLSNPCTKTLHPRHPPVEMQLFMDASTSFGIGIMVEGHIAAWRLLPHWRRPGIDIGWAEMAAVEITLAAIIGRGIQNCTATFHSDNKGVIFALQAGRSRNEHQNRILMRIRETAAQYNIDIEITYIKSSENPADGPSRGILPPDMPPIQWPFTFPPDLSQLMTRCMM
ncbi:Zn_clus Fungal Zn(2)-Cys(6) binuclear cluster domain [Rhizoctonia solani AG-1 IB]|uniref:Zn_clus Fungal Zn(2)-Cys(6) binuclear cluster domain n=1 Tax=Thanatephorus cucumeris (strain AG1-IB / isolate 7/3/14) TaxID=1108050 RepID=A0A0B7F5K6_THACB|nr:Zn_clus Fungal Zn(2)-Cys(6) binuclear cluster domain [Rhizoctonia solani AG-1 IB]